MKTCIQTLGILALATSLSFGEEAAEAKKGGDPAKAFAKTDSNSDGSVSLEEFKASPRGVKMADKAEGMFKKMDADSNGSLSADEFKAGPAKGGKGGKGGGKGGKGGGKGAPAPAPAPEGE